MSWQNNDLSKSQSFFLHSFVRHLGLFRIFVRKNMLQNMRRLIISLVAMVTMQSIFAADRLSALPCPILGGELSNSAATSVADIDEVMPRMKTLGLNTVLVPA